MTRQVGRQKDRLTETSRKERVGGWEGATDTWKRENHFDTRRRRAVEGNYNEPHPDVLTGPC